MGRSAWILFACLLPVGAGWARADDEPIGRDDLRSVVLAAHRSLADVEFVYEGYSKLLAAPDLDSIPPANRNPAFGVGDRRFFQGRFAYANEGLGHLDVYTWRPGGEEPPTREVFCLPGDGKRYRRPFAPGGGGAGSLATESGWIGTFLGSYYPLNLFLRPYLLVYLNQPASDYEYECGGWEDIDGRRCLVARFHGPGRSSTDTYWIDLERDAHPLRLERSSRDGLSGCVTDVDLRRVGAGDGTTVWFPMRSRYLNYQGLAALSKTPLIEETYGVVTSTLLLNRSPDRSRFRISYRPEEDDAPPAWREAVAAKAKAPEIDASRTVTERLQGKLAEENARSEELRADGPRDPWYWRYGPGALFLGGAVLLAGTFVWSRLAATR